MKLRCREGDQAIIIREEAGCDMNIGRVVTVHGPVWFTEERGPTWLIVPVQADTWAVGSYIGGPVWHGRITLENEIEHPDDWLLPLRPEQETDAARGKAEKAEPAGLADSVREELGIESWAAECAETEDGDTAVNDEPGDAVPYSENTEFSDQENIDG